MNLKAPLGKALVRTLPPKHTLFAAAGVARADNRIAFSQGPYTQQQLLQWQSLLVLLLPWAVARTWLLVNRL